jgi:hypothetical protein
MISAKELDFVKAHEQFQRMCEFLDQALSEGASGQTVNTLERKDRALSSARSRPAGQPLANHLPKRAAREFAFNSEFAYHVRFAMLA